MNKKIKTALISVYYKDGLAPIVKKLNQLGVTIYSTGGTQQFIESLQIPCITVESLTGYPSILGGRVKTLHPSVFGAILGRRDQQQDLQEMDRYHIPEIDLVIVDLYPFEETLAQTTEDKAIIEKIDVGGPSMIRAAAKNHRDVAVISARQDYARLEKLLDEQKGETTLEQRRELAARAFEICAHYDVIIARYFIPAGGDYFLQSVPEPHSLRYGENPHQEAHFYGQLTDIFEQLNGKDLSYNNLVDVDAAVQLIQEFGTSDEEPVFAIIKHTNPCGIAIRPTLKEAWEAALAGDPESAFGGVLACNKHVDKATAEAINEIFFEVLIAPAFEPAALEILRGRRNRILLAQKKPVAYATQFKSVLGGVLTQQYDDQQPDEQQPDHQRPDGGHTTEWKEAGGRPATATERSDLVFANIVCKHLKSNAIALVRNKQLIGKGCGQTSRVDAVRQSLEKARHYKFDLKGAVLASDAFFPFSDSIQLAHAAGIGAFIQPGGSIRDKESIDYCVEHQLALVITGQRHFRH